MNGDVAAHARGVDAHPGGLDSTSPWPSTNAPPIRRAKTRPRRRCGYPCAGQQDRRTALSPRTPCSEIVQGGMYEPLGMNRWRNWKPSASTATRWGPRGGRAQGGAQPHPGAHRGAHAAGQAALPDGDGHAGRHRRGRGLRHRHDGLRAADAQRAQRLSSRATETSASATRATATIPRRSTRSAPATPAGISAAPTSTTCRR